MDKLATIVRATRASASAIQAIARHCHAIRSFERIGDTRNAALIYPKLCRAQRRYHRAQQTLRDNPMEGDRT